MYDNSNIFDLTLSIPADSCSLFNTQYTRKSFYKDPLETNSCFAFDNNLLYYNQQLLSTRHLLDYSKESPETTTRKARVVLPGKDRKSVKFRRHFFVIFFNEKEIEHRLLNNLNQISLDLFNVKYKLNSGFDVIFYLCIALQLTIYINKSIALICDRFVNAGEPAAVVESLKERSLVICHLSLGGGFGTFILNGCMIAWLLGNFLIINCQFKDLKVRSLVISERG
jgi:hypothetical protein